MSLVVWDRVFGTYRQLPAGAAAHALPYGIEANVGTPSVWALNTAHLRDPWAPERRPASPGGAGTAAMGAVGWAVVVALTVQLVHQQLALGWHLAAVAVGSVWAAGRSLEENEAVLRL